jgi:3-deoxy-7-phosphoheptulonate synthase/chorismate mutase
VDIARQDSIGRAVAADPAPELRRLRARMDRLNRRLAAVLQERARLADEIGALKRRQGLPAADPAREREMLAAVLDGAPRGFAREDLERIFKVVFRTSRARVEAARRRP